MAWSSELVELVRGALARENVVEHGMFGALIFMVDSHMCCGVENDRMMVRVGPNAFEAFLHRSGVRPFDVTGKPLIGMIWVDPSVLRSKLQVQGWVDAGLVFLRSLPSEKAA
ncbi:TfoX/Sxy family protein [Luteimonas salinilitoris]|uniref:TfoX/Sxy family protein n=1 Tax=Luteimonas salinilitoris TaxID=3237697 RepID=A0ABV4HVM3_9GAMM